jgi:hypothetical protein
MPPAPAARSEPAAAAAPLPYAPAPKWHRRKDVRRYVLLGLVLAITFAGWRWGPAAWKHGQFLYWQRQCLAYVPAPRHVVYETEPTLAAGLLKQPGYVNVAPKGAPPVAAYTPRCWSEAMRIGGVAVANTGFGPGGPGACLFLHERTTRSGVRRLVAVHAPAGTPAVAAVPVPAPVIVQPATLTARPAVRDAVARVQLDLSFEEPSGGRFSLLSMPTGSGTRFFDGQADPADPSHFTIPFEAGGSRGTVEGWLEEGDRLRLAFNSRPATVAATSQPAREQDPGRVHAVKGTITVDATNLSAAATQPSGVNKRVRFDGVSIGSAPQPPPSTAP